MIGIILSLFIMDLCLMKTIFYYSIFFRKTLPGKFFELNIHYGLFVGDNKNKNNTDIFFGHVEKFRGCISEVSNPLTILQMINLKCNNLNIY